MDIKKQKAFNERMGKRQKYSKGGLVRRIGNRQYFDTGGVAGPSTASTGSVQGTSGVGGVSYPNFIPGSSVINSVNPFPGLQNSVQNQFQAQGAPIQAGTNADQLNSAYGQVQNGLGLQQGIVNQAAGQNGFANQSNVFGQQQQLAAQMAQENGLGNQQRAAQGFTSIANGTGPNLAQSQLNQTTGQNVANQAALMAGQRGASANAGLLARQSAQQGAATQQQAVGQGAILQAQQQQNALNNLGNIGTSQVGQQQAQQQNLQNVAANQINTQGQAVTGYNTAAQNAQNTLQGANSNFNNTSVGSQSNVNNVNAGISQGNQTASTNLEGGVFNGLASAAGPLSAPLKGLAGGFADGGEVTANLGASNYNAPENIAPASIGSPPAVNVNAKSKKQSDDDSSSPLDAASSLTSGGGEEAAGGDLAGEATAVAPEAVMLVYRGGNIYKGPHQSHVANYLAQGGRVPAMVSPGEIYLSPDKVKRVIEQGENPLKIGDRIPGKAKVRGDSLKNDTVPTTLEEGGVVVPRHILKHKNSEKAELFVRRAVHLKKAGK